MDEVTGSDPAKTPAGRRTWFLPSLLFLLATAVYGAVLYPGMKDPVPVHWNGAGEPDEFAAKSVAAVFTPLMIGAGVVAFLWALHLLLPKVPAQGSGQDPALAAANAEAGRGIIAGLAPGMALLFSWLSLLGWLGLNGPAAIWTPVLALMAYMTAVSFRAMSSAAANQPPR